MRRALTALLAVFYLCICTGVTLHQHYCMGDFIGTSLFHTEDGDTHECPRCGVEKENSGNRCCTEEHKVLKSDEEHVGAKVLSVPAPFFAAAALPPQGFPALPPQLVALHTAPAPTANAPPAGLASCPLFIRHCSFRI